MSRRDSTRLDSTRRDARERVRSDFFGKNEITEIAAAPSRVRDHAADARVRAYALDQLERVCHSGGVHELGDAVERDDASSALARRAAP